MMKRKKCPASLLVEAKNRAEFWRQHPPYRPRYTNEEGGGWIEFPEGWNDRDILPFCDEKHRIITTYGAIVSIEKDGGAVLCHSVMFSNGDVWDAFNLGIRREIMFKRNLEELSARYLLPRKYNELLGLRPHQRVSTWVNA
jgi:hypothetical protein